MNMAILYETFLPDNVQIILIETTKVCNFELYDTEEFYTDVF